MGRQEPARRLDLTPSFLSDLLSTLTERGRALLRGTFSGNGETKLAHQELIQLGETLLSRRGQATGVALPIGCWQDTPRPRRRIARASSNRSPIDSDPIMRGWTRRSRRIGRATQPRSARRIRRRNRGGRN